MPETELKNTHWFALYTKPRHEFKAAIELESIGIEYYLPTITVYKQWSDRKKKVTEPLFRGYIFIYAGERGRFDAMQQKSIVRTVSFEGKPAVIPAWQIENVKKLLEDDPDVFVTDQIKEGTKVKVVSGPFVGVEGVVSYMQNERTLSITVETLHRSIVVTLPANSVTQKVES